MSTPGSPAVAASPKTLRNGLDYVPKKTYPPDYSSVPDIRSWQMSPFSHERFDLNEIEIAQKKGVKYKAELDALLSKYGGGEKKKKEETKAEPPPCPKCAEREKAKANKGKCDVDYLYQPYGPSVLSTVSYRNVGLTNYKNKVFCVTAPLYSDFRIDRRNPQRIDTPLTCKGYGGKNSKKTIQSGTYIPYGPTGNRFTSFVYEPMGPALKFAKQKF